MLRLILAEGNVSLCNSLLELSSTKLALNPCISFLLDLLVQHLLLLSHWLVFGLLQHGSEGQTFLLPFGNSVGFLWL